MRTLSFLCGVLLLWSTVSHADLYQWTDTDGVLHVVDDAGEVLEVCRSKQKLYRTAKHAGPGKSTMAMLAPSRDYAANSQGVFAQQLAGRRDFLRATEQIAGPRQVVRGTCGALCLHGCRGGVRPILRSPST